MKEVIIFSNFVNIPNKHGVYALLDMEHCMSCSQYVKDLKNYNTDEWTLVAMTEEDSKELLLSEGLRPPITRVYNNNLIDTELRGILYSRQIKTVYNAVSKLSNNNISKIEKTASNSFKTVLAKPKNIQVQCFLANKILNVELLGQEITAREGQWVIMYEDNRIEILDDDIFKSRFDIEVHQ